MSSSNYPTNHTPAELSSLTDGQSLDRDQNQKVLLYSHNLLRLVAARIHYNKGQQHSAYTFTEHRQNFICSFVNNKQEIERSKSSHDKSLAPVSSFLESSNDGCQFDQCAWPVYNERTYTYINNKVYSYHSQSCCHYSFKHTRSLCVHRSTTLTPSRLSTKFNHATQSQYFGFACDRKRTPAKSERRGCSHVLYGPISENHAARDVDVPVFLRLTVLKPTLGFRAHPSQRT